MTPNYRKFCSDLIEVLEQYAPLHENDAALVSRVRACIQAETLLEAVGMEKELCNPLMLTGYTSVEQVLEADPKDLMECKGLGPDRVGRILAAIRKHKRESAMEDLRQVSAYVSGVELTDHFPDVKKMVPTQRQLRQLAAEFWPEGWEPTQATSYARAVLARWGNHPGFPDSSPPLP